MRPVDPTRSRIVLLGTPFYTATDLADVPVIANNLSDLAAVFTNPHLGGFPRENCVVVPEDANVSEIGDLLIEAAEEAEDLLLFYYAGHGVLSPRRRDLHLSLRETRPGSRVEFTALPFEAVRNACLESKAENRAVILDSCFSGRAIGETLTNSAEEIIEQIRVSGTYTLTSAPANRAALVLDGERHTAFTERLIAFLGNGCSTAGPMLTLGDIYLHLHTLLRAEGLPTPQQCGTETADRLGLVRNSAVTAPTSAPPRSRPEPAEESELRAETAAPPLDGLFAGLGSAFADPPTNTTRDPLGSPLDSLFSDLGLGDSTFRTPTGASSAQRSSPTRKRRSSADFVVEPGGTVHDARRETGSGSGDNADATTARLPAGTGLYWSVRRGSEWLAASAGILLGLVNIGLALWVTFGSASGQWLWLLIPGAIAAFGIKLGTVDVFAGALFSAAVCFGAATCAAASVMIAMHRQLAFLSSGKLILLEIFVIMASASRWDAAKYKV